MSFNQIILLIFFYFYMIILLNCLRDREDYSKVPIPIYKINLDLPIRQRYEKIIPQYASVIKEMLDHLKTIKRVRYINLIGKFILFLQPKEYYDEIKVMSSLLNITISDLAINAVTYELFSGCSSIIFQNRKKEILFGRNLDYGTAYYIHKISYQAEVYKNGEHIYDAIYLAGFVGAHTAYSTKLQITISLNQRSNKSILTSVMRFWSGKLTPIYVIRLIMENQLNYNNTQNFLNNVEITANCYFIVSGRNEGYVLSRDIEIKNSSTDYLDVEKGIWFLVQTNYDRNLTDPKYDSRRAPVEDKLNHLGNEIDELQFFDKIMSKFPSNNKLTASTTIIKNGLFNTTIWTGGYEKIKKAKNLI